jgi:hypothetical protein
VNLQARLSPWYLIVLWLVLAGVCRLGTPTLAVLGGQDHPEAWGLGGMLVTLFVLGAALFFILGMGYLYQSRPVMQPREPFPAQPVPQYTSEVEVEFQPNMVFIPWPDGSRKTLHISNKQLDEIQHRIGAKKLRLPVNGMETFTSSGMARLRREMVAQDMAVWTGMDHNIARMTQEGAAAIMMASPTAVVKRSVRANV